MAGPVPPPIRAIRTALDALAFSSVWLAAAGGALCAASSLAMGFPPALPVVAIACAGTLVVYTVAKAAFDLGGMTQYLLRCGLRSFF